jgi:hypothetical protein
MDFFVVMNPRSFNAFLFGFFWHPTECKTPMIFRLFEKSRSTRHEQESPKHVPSPMSIRRGV